MRSRTGAVVVVVALGAIAGTIGASASSSVAGPTDIQALEQHKVQRVVDLGEKGITPGDVLTVRDQLATPEGTTALGHMHEVCTVVSAKRGSVSYECAGTAVFQDGQVSTIGEVPPTDPDSSFVVTGGTGVYENVGGMLTAEPTAAGLLLTFHLVP